MAVNGNIKSDGCDSSDQIRTFNLRGVAMGDSYVEVMVKRKNSPLLGAGKVVLWGLAIIFLLLGAMTSWAFLVAALVFGAAAYFLIPMLDLEFEYLYLNKEISIDKIMAKEKRKHCATLDLNKMEFMAPENSHELDSQKAGNYKVIDFSSKETERKAYIIVYNDNDGTKLYKLEPTVEMLSAIKQVFPRKVVEY